MFYLLLGQEFSIF